MPYWTKDDRIFFFTNRQWEELRYAALANKDPQFRVGSKIRGTKENKEARRIFGKYLESVWKKDSLSFIDKYAQFDFSDDEARNNISTLLSDWACIYKDVAITHGLYSTPEQSIFDDMMGVDQNFPYGQVIKISLGISSGLTIPIPRIMQKKSVQTAEYVIPIKSILSVMGTLRCFTIELPNYIVTLGEIVSIIPKSDIVTGSTPIITTDPVTPFGDFVWLPQTVDEGYAWIFALVTPLKMMPEPLRGEVWNRVESKLAFLAKEWLDSGYPDQYLEEQLPNLIMVRDPHGLAAALMQTSQWMTVWNKIEWEREDRKTRPLRDEDSEFLEECDLFEVVARIA